MKISEILNKDKQSAIKGNCKQEEPKEVKQPKWVNPWEGMSDEEIAKAKGITVSQLNTLRAARRRHKKNRHKRLQEKIKLWRENKIKKAANENF